MDLSIRHTTTYRYESPASQVDLLLRLQPAALDNQVPLTWAVSVNGVPVPAFALNAYGDGEVFFHLKGSVAEAVIVAEGRVETRDRNGIVSGFRQEAPLPVFLRQTPLTRPDEALAALAREVRGLDPVPRLHALSTLVRERIQYRPGATSSATPAGVALALGAGVCQDHAHAFASAARLLGVPTRYVAGYLLVDGAGPALRETHAWSEAWVEGLGWLGFDATNGLCITDHYVRLCCGLDAQDAAPVKGSVHGATAIAIRADVMIGLVEPGATQQIQQQQ